jgi:TctA family transporter
MLIFFQRPIAAVLTCLAILAVLVPTVRGAWALARGFRRATA